MNFVIRHSSFVILAFLASCATPSDPPPPAAPAIAVSKTRMLAWTARPAAEQPITYRIYTGAGAFIASTSSTSYRLPRGQTYYVTSKNIRQESGPSQKIHL